MVVQVVKGIDCLYSLQIDLNSLILTLANLIFLFKSSQQYDCSSADINPIGSVSKQDLRKFLRWAAIHLGYPSLAQVEAAPPTAELEPIRSDYSQVSLC